MRLPWPVVEVWNWHFDSSDPVKTAAGDVIGLTSRDKEFKKWAREKGYLRPEGWVESELLPARGTGAYYERQMRLEAEYRERQRQNGIAEWMVQLEAIMKPGGHFDTSMEYLAPLAARQAVMNDRAFAAGQRALDGKPCPPPLRETLPDGRNRPVDPKALEGMRQAALPEAPAAPRPVPGAGGVRPQRGTELGRGVDGVVYDIPGEPGWVLKEFHHPGLQARNQHANMEAARRIRPNNVLEAQPPADPRQGWLARERYYPSDTPPDAAQLREVLRDFQNINDAAGNLRWGYTQGNPTPRWLLIE